jgi:hypothetical protein
MQWTIDGANAIITCAAARPEASGKPSATSAHSDANRLTSPIPKMILITYKIDTHPASASSHQYKITKHNSPTAARLEFAVSARSGAPTRTCRFRLPARMLLTR